MQHPKETVLLARFVNHKMFLLLLLLLLPSFIYRNAYATVAGKYQDVLTLEASVAELHQMFLDFALLTEQQGELLDQIEFQVKSAGEYVEQANEEVVEAIEISKRVRKKQWYVLFVRCVPILTFMGTRASNRILFFLLLFQVSLLQS